MSREARAAALRAQLEKVAPDMVVFLDQMKDGFGATVLFVEAPGISHGKEPAPGIRPYAPMSSSTWPYEVGRSPGDAYKTKVQQQPKGRKVKR